MQRKLSFGPKSHLADPGLYLRVVRIDTVASCTVDTSLKRVKSKMINESTNWEKGTSKGKSREFDSLTTYTSL